MYIKVNQLYISSVQFSCSVVADFLWPHGLQHASVPCPSPTPGACSNSCPMSQWFHLPSSHLIFCCTLLLPPSICPSFRVFSNESVLCIRWQQYWSFTFIISPSNECSGVISFRIHWLNFLAFEGLALRDSQESSSTTQFKSISSSAFSFLYSPTLTSIHDYWKNQSFD